MNKISEVIPWSPLAKGKLTRNWEEASARWEKEAVGQKFYPQASESDRQVVERVAEVAEKRGVPELKSHLLGCYKRTLLLLSNSWVYESISP